MNWLLPLETIPGWPEGPPISDFHMLMLLFIGPLLLGVVVSILAFTPQLARRFREQATEPSSTDLAVTDSPRRDMAVDSDHATAPTHGTDETTL